MERTYQKKNYDVLIKVVHTILVWVVRAMYIGIGILVVAFLASLFIPKSVYEFDLANIENINVQVAHFMYNFNGSIFTGVVNVKWFVNLLLIAGVVNASFFLYLLMMLRNVLGNVKEKQPFSDQNILSLKRMGLAYLLAGVILPAINTWLLWVIVKLVDLSSAGVNYSLNLQLIFMGIVIVILAYVFEYGAYLQEEHDATV